MWTFIFLHLQSMSGSYEENKGYGLKPWLKYNFKGRNCSLFLFRQYQFPYWSILVCPQWLIISIPIGHHWCVPFDWYRYSIGCYQCVPIGWQWCVPIGWYRRGDAKWHFMLFFIIIFCTSRMRLVLKETCIVTILLLLLLLLNYKHYYHYYYYDYRYYYYYY